MYAISQFYFENNIFPTAGQLNKYIREQQTVPANLPDNLPGSDINAKMPALGEFSHDSNSTGVEIPRKRKRTGSNKFS